MYPVSDDYKDAILKSSRAHKLGGTVNSVSFTGEDVVRGTFTVRNQLCQATAISLGGVYVGEMDLVFSTEFAQNMNLRGSWRGVPITASIGVELLDSTFEYVPVPGGTYTIAEASWTNQGLKVVAYDNMQKLDKPLAADQSSGTIYDFLSWACVSCGLTLGMTQNEVEALPNGTETFGLYPDDAIETFRDMISQLAAACCCFATIDRQGRLVLRRFPDKTDINDEITAKMRYSTAFSDYTSFYDSISVVNIEEGTTSVYSNDNVNGLIMNIGSNPFLQYGTDEIKDRERQAIADALENFEATPFSVSILPNPAFDLGDLIEFSGGIGQGAIGCVMSFVMKVDSTTLEGYGENPALSDLRSKTDKDISGLIGKATSDSEVVIHTFENAMAFTLAEDVETTILNIKFATLSPKVINLWHEIDLDVTASSQDGVVTCTAYYYLNDELITFTPVTTWDNNGMHLLHLLYFLKNLLGGTAYEWKVKLKMSGGSATIAIGNIHASLYGQGLVAVEKWDGLIEITDEYSPVTLGDNLTFSLADEVTSLALITPISTTLSDNYSPITLGDNLTVGLSDSVTIITERESFYIGSENGEYQLGSEDGSIAIRNEE